MKTSITQSLHPSGCTAATYAYAVEQGYDLVQAKARGQPCRLQISRGEVRVYGWDDSPICDHIIQNDLAAGTFLGVYVKPDLIMIHDCVEIAQQSGDNLRLTYTDLSTFSYRDRFAFVKQQLTMIDLPCFKPVQNYRIDMASHLWDHLDTEITCGLVYRRASGTLREPIFVARKYPEAPGGLP